MARSKNNQPITAATLGYEAELWKMADALRGSMDAAEYKKNSHLLGSFGSTAVSCRPSFGSMGGVDMPVNLCYAFRPQQCLYFLPLPHGHGSLRPTRGVVR